MSRSSLSKKWGRESFINFLARSMIHYDRAVWVSCPAWPAPERQPIYEQKLEGIVTSNQRRLFVLFAAIALLSSCSRGTALPQGAYRVATETVSDGPTSITRRYDIETSSRRTLSLAEHLGRNSADIGPRTVPEERTAKTQVTVTITLEESGEDAHVLVKVLVDEEGGVTRWESTMSVPPGTDLTSLLKEEQPVGNITTKTSLLRVESEGRYLELVVE